MPSKVTIALPLSSNAGLKELSIVDMNTISLPGGTAAGGSITFESNTQGNFNAGVMLAALSKKIPQVWRVSGGLTALAHEPA